MAMTDGYPFIFQMNDKAEQWSGGQVLVSLQASGARVLSRA